MSSASTTSSFGFGSLRWPFKKGSSHVRSPSAPVRTHAPSSDEPSGSKPPLEKSEKDKGKAPAAPNKEKPEDQDGADPQNDTNKSSAPQLNGSDPDSKLDIVFLQDTTASQGPYIEAAKKAIETICDKISTKTKMAPENIRFGLIAFRDHPPQDRTYVTLDFPFTSDRQEMMKNLKSLKPQGGGDGPEAVTAALAGALNMPWREDTTKMVVLITDAPPHGIGEAHDGFDSSPDQNDPLEIARQMAERGITLFMVACEPTLSTSYVNAVDFYAALTDITGGRMLPLTMADKLGDYIAGNAVETIETEKLIKQYKDKIVDNVYGQSKPLEEVVAEMQKDLESKNVHINTYEAPSAYVSYAAAEENKVTWQSAKSIGSARGAVKKVEGARYAPSPSYAAAPTPSGSAAPGAPPPPPAAPGSSMFSRKIDLSQTKRVVMQSMARSSKVTESGMTLKDAAKAGAAVVALNTVL